MPWPKAPPPGVLAIADELAARGLSYTGALADLAILLSRIAVEQRVPGVTPVDDPLAADIARLAAALHPDAVQLFYAVAVHSRGELALAPDEYAGFIMACLRMLALHSDAGPRVLHETPARPAVAATASVATSPPMSSIAAEQEALAAVPLPPADIPPWEDTPRSEAGNGDAPVQLQPTRGRLADVTPANWPELAARLPLTGLAGELARQSEWMGVQGDTVRLRVAVKTLAQTESCVRLQMMLGEHFGQAIKVEIEIGTTGAATARAVEQAERTARQQAAEAAVAADPFVQALVKDFGGQVVPGSVRPIDPPLV